jgi:hypothetical protein
MTQTELFHNDSYPGAQASYSPAWFMINREISSRDVTTACRYRLPIQQMHILCGISHEMSISTKLVTKQLKNITLSENVTSYLFI